MEIIKLPLKQGTHLDWEAYDADDKICFIAFDGAEASPEKTAALVEIINQRDQLLEALKEVESDLWQQIEGKHGPKIASEYPSIVKAKAARAAAKGE